MSDVLRSNRLATGATDDTAATGEIFPAGGVYQGTVSEVDSGDIGRMRMSARRAALHAMDGGITNALFSDIDSSEKYIDDILFYNLHTGLLGSTDGSTPGTTSVIVIPLAVNYWRDIFIHIRTGANFFDQATTLGLYSAWNNTVVSNSRSSKLMEITLSASTDVRISMGNGKEGQGGSAGGATASDRDHYEVSVPEAAPYIQLLLTASTAPTTGQELYRVVIGRVA
jgi:hypothetical protein